MNKELLDEKDILELLNYINRNEADEDINIEMNDLRKKRIKKNLMKQIKSKGNIWKFRYGVTAAVLLCIILVGAVIPTFAKNIPILNSIIQRFNDKNGRYERYSQLLNKSVSDKGITLTINEVLCDDSDLMMGYTIKSEENIKDIIKEKMDKNFRPFFLGNYLKINGEKDFGSGGNTGKYTDDHTYVGACEINISDKSLPETFNIDLDVKDIGGIEGNWKFSFIYSKSEILQKTKVFKPDTKVKLPDSIVNIKKVTFTPINTSIMLTGKYNNKEYKDSDKRAKAFGTKNLAGEMKYDNWFVLDNEGNEIIPKGSLGKSVEHSLFSDFNYEFKFVALKQVPKYLTIIPYRFPDYGDTYSPKEEGKSINGVYPIELSQGKIGKTIVREIDFQKDKTVVKYTTEGLAPFSQAKELFIKDSQGNIVNRKEVSDIGSIRKYEDKSNEYIMEFQALNKDKKYIVGTRNFDDFDIREDLEFRINLDSK